MLSGCAASGPAVAPPPILLDRPTLPPAPTLFGKPVAIPNPVVGQDARLYAARLRAALLEANGRLDLDRTFYAAVQREFGGTP